MLTVLSKLFDNRALGQPPGDLRGVLDREKAEIGVLITMEEPTRPMRTEAASGGFYTSPGWGRDYPKLQILTVGELLDGKGVAMPPIRHVSKTFKKAPRVKKNEEKTAKVRFGGDRTEPGDDL